MMFFAVVLEDVTYFVSEITVQNLLEKICSNLRETANFVTFTEEIRNLSVPDVY